jgi:hypothetical protein
VTALYWLRYGFLLLLVATAVWFVWLATADVHPKRRHR